MKFNRLGFGAIVLLTLTIGGCFYVGSIVVRSLDPFPVLEFVDKSGPSASRKMYSWDFTIDPSAVRRVSMKSASSIDSYSTWSKFELSPSDAETLSSELHKRMAAIDDYLQRTKECEQATRTITSIPIRAPTSETPDWWAAPTGTGNATENMLWYLDATYGVAQGCYTIYDSQTETLWVYKYAAQHDSHWERGARPPYAYRPPPTPRNRDTGQNGVRTISYVPPRAERSACRSESTSKRLS